MNIMINIINNIEKKTDKNNYYLFFNFKYS